MRAKQSPGFLSKRLEEARQLLGLNDTQLAEKLGTTKQNYQHYKKGTTPPESFLHDLCFLTGLPLGFFYKEAKQSPPSLPFFRSMASTSRRAMDRSSVYLHWLSEIFDYIQIYIQSPSVNIPMFSLPDEIEALRLDDIEDLAMEARRFWGLADRPISNLTWMLERNGFVIANCPLADEKLDGLSDWIDGRPFILVNQEKDAAVRQRFDIAHELGHLLMHRGIDRQRMKEDKPFFKLIEQQAHRFASAFLFPATSFSKELFFPSMELMKRLKMPWKLSLAAMIMRANDLKMISPNQKINFFRQLGGRKKEYLDDLIEKEEPKLLQKSIKLLLDEKVLDRSTLKAALALDAGRIEMLTALPMGFLDEMNAEIVQLRPKFQTSVSTPSNVTPPQKATVSSLDGAVVSPNVRVVSFTERLCKSKE